MDVAYQLMSRDAASLHHYLYFAVALHVAVSCTAVVDDAVELIAVVDNTAAVDYIAVGSFAAYYWYVVGSYYFVVAYCYFVVNVAVSSYQLYRYSSGAYYPYYFGF